MSVPNPKNISDGGEALKQFQLTTESIKDKSSKEYGLAISRYINDTITSGLGGYYFNRNARFRKNRNYANGRINVEAMFQDRLQMDGKQNYIKLNWQTLQIVNRIVSGLVGRWMNKGEKISVTAIDSLSVKDKQNEYDQMEFIIDNRAKLEALQKESGVQLIPQDKDLPGDKDELKLWQAQFQRIAEEILYEIGCNDVLSSNGWFDVLKEKMLHDAAEVLFVGTYTWMDKQGVIHVDWVEPENAIYSSSKYPDFRDTKWRGQAPTIRISDLRRRYGKEFNPGNPLALTEDQLWEIAQKAKEFQYYTNITWTDTWYSSFLRPYDEWNVRSIEFELKTVDSEPYTVTKTKTSGTTYTQKGYPSTASGKRREKPLENQQVLDDSNYNIYRGVYLPDSNILLEWGLKDNMIRPQDPKEIGNAEFSYSFYMPQNYEMRNMAIPEKIEAAVDGMILALLKMQQVVARMRPTGAAIDESALQNIDYGLGDAGNKDIDYKKLYDQTGDIYYRGVDAEGNRVPIPIQELANSGFLGQMDGLIKNYQFNYQSLKDELGEDPNLISAALQPRVTAGNVEASQLQAEYATDYIYRAYAECMKITARKVSCLLKDSVTYGSSAYRNLISQEDIGDRIFSTDIKFLPTAQEVQMFQMIVNDAMKSTPELVLFLDPLQLMRVAKEDVKMAELLFRQGQKKMLIHQQMMAQQNQQATFDAQRESAIVGEQEKGKNMQMELKMKGKQSEKQGKVDKEKIVLQGVFELAKLAATPQTVGADGSTTKPGSISPSLSELIELSIKNIAMPLAMDNAEIASGVEEGEEQQEQNIPQNQNNQPQVAA